MKDLYCHLPHLDDRVIGYRTALPGGDAIHIYESFDSAADAARLRSSKVTKTVTYGYARQGLENDKCIHMQSRCCVAFWDLACMDPRFFAENHYVQGRHRSFPSGDIFRLKRNLSDHDQLERAIVGYVVRMISGELFCDPATGLIPLFGSGEDCLRFCQRDGIDGTPEPVRVPSICRWVEEGFPINCDESALQRVKGMIGLGRTIVATRKRPLRNYSSLTFEWAMRTSRYLFEEPDILEIPGMMGEYLNSLRTRREMSAASEKGASDSPHGS